MDAKTVQTVANVGIAMNLAAGHVGEMTGKAMQAAGNAIGCSVATTAGKAVEAAGRAWADMAVAVGNRDRARLTQ